MQPVKRYNLATGVNEGSFEPMLEDEEGLFVLATNYAALQQQLVDERKQNELLQQALEASDPDKLKQQLAQAQGELGKQDAERTFLQSRLSHLDAAVRYVVKKMHDSTIVYDMDKCCKRLERALGGEVEGRRD